MAIQNFSWVIPHKLAGCALPGGFKPRNSVSVQTDLDELCSRGVKTLVSLHRVDRGFGEWCNAAGLTWINFPLEDFGVPADLSLFTGLVNAIVQEMKLEKPVCVHCHAGVGRTGLVLACVVGTWFLLDGRAAIAAVRASRTAIDTNEQEEFVRDYLRHSTASAKGTR